MASARPAKKAPPRGGAARATPEGFAYAAGEKAGRAVRSSLAPKGRLTSANPRRLLLAEFLAVFVVLGAGTIVAPSGKGGGVPRLMVRGTALAVLFMVLALVSSTGPKMAKAAAALGALIVLGYVFTSQDAANLWTWTAAFFSRQGTAAPAAGAATSSGALGEAGLILQSALSADQATALMQGSHSVGDAAKIIAAAFPGYQAEAGAADLIGGIESPGTPLVPVHHGGSTAE